MAAKAGKPVKKRAALEEVEPVPIDKLALVRKMIAQCSASLNKEGAPKTAVSDLIRLVRTGEGTGGRADVSGDQGEMGRVTRDGICCIEIEHSPLPSQRRFHESPARFKGFSGPIGSGKSQALCHQAIRMTYENPGRMGVLAAPTFTMLRDATQRALIEILEANRLPFEFNKAENQIVMKDTRSKIVFRSLEEFERLRGTNLAWFGVDELTYTVEEAWLRSGRTPAGSESVAAVWVRGVDSEGIRLGV